MVEAVSFTDNTNRNTAIAAGVGAIGGGTAGYMTKKIFKDGEFTDEFVKSSINNVMDSLVEEKENREIMKDLYNLGDEPDIKSAKKFLKKWEKQIESYPDEIKELLNKSDKEILDETKVFRESIMNDVGEEGKSLRQVINEMFEEAKNIYTKHKNSFKINKDELADIDSLFTSDKELKAFSKAEKSIKGKAGLIWGAATAIVLGAGTYILSKVFGHKEA